MVQGPLVSSLSETVAVSTCTHYSMVRAEISCRNVNASRCHTALQHIDDSEVWSTIFLFSSINFINESPRKKIHDLLLLKRTKHNFCTNLMVFGLTKMTQNGRSESPTKNKNFPSLIIFDQKARKWPKFMFFEKKLCFWKIWKLMAFDQNSLTITHETAKYDEKI